MVETFNKMDQEEFPIGSGNHQPPVTPPAVSLSVGETDLIHSDPRLAWTKYCGFLDLSVTEFIEIQEQLLVEQVDLVHESPLGRRLLRGSRPASIAEFREKVPLTHYGDYLPFLSSGRDDVMGEGPVTWAHTTGAQAGFKAVPYTRRGLERVLDNLMAAFILAAASHKGDVNVWPGDTILYNTPERPYLSGLATFGMGERFQFTGVLTPEESESLDFKERVRQGFKEGLGKNIDVIIAISSVLVKVGESFTDHSKSTRFDRSMLRPRVLARYAKAYLTSKLLRRPILPKDLWPAKSIIGWGIDTPFFREKIQHYWGRLPFEIYACTEGGIMGMQSWDQEGLVFSPYSDLVEFIPMDQSLKSREDERFVPETVLLDEVEAGESYEVVITNFYGMAFIRYRVGHFVKFLPSDNHREEGGLPQFEFLGRADDRIDLGGFTRLDEKTVWEALALTSLQYEDWSVRKEFQDGLPTLRMYIELKEPFPNGQLREVIHEKLKEVDPFYGDLESMLGIQALQTTSLPKGTYDRFYDQRLSTGAELGRLRPPRMNATDEDIRDLLKAAG